MGEEDNSCVASAVVIYLNTWVTMGRPLTQGHWNQADRGNLIWGLMGALRARTSFHGKGPMAGLTRMLVQLCTAEELAYMTLWAECNSLKASAAIPFWRGLQPGMSSFQTEAGISDPSLQKHHCNGRKTTKPPRRRHKSYQLPCISEGCWDYPLSQHYNKARIILHRNWAHWFMS